MIYQNLSKMHPQRPIQTGKLSTKASLGRIAKRFFKKEDTNENYYPQNSWKATSVLVIFEFQFVCDQA